MDMRIGEPLTFVDIETTGGAQDSRVLEVGIVRVEGNRVVDTFQTLLNPIDYVPPIITRLTGITSEMVQGAPEFYQIADRVQEMFEGSILVAHNASFDYGFLRAEFARTDREFTPKVLCTVQLSRQLFPQYRRHNLETVIARHGITVSSRHRAYDDAQALWQLYQVILREHDLDTVEAAINRQLVPRAALVRSRPTPGPLALGRIGYV